MASTDTTKPEGLRPARRTIVKGAAWAVPAIAVAAPAHAATASDYLTFQQLDYCKNPGQSCSTLPFGYQFNFSVDNAYECDIQITSTVWTRESGSVPGTLSLPPFLIPNAGSADLLIIVNSTNSANAVFSGYFTLHFLDCEGNPDTAKLPVVVDGTHPDCPCPEAPDATETQAETGEIDEEPAADTASTDEATDNN